MFAETLRRMLIEEGGQDLVEWALLAAFIAIVAILILFVFRYPLLGMYQSVFDQLTFVTNHL